MTRTRRAAKPASSDIDHAVLARLTGEAADHFAASDSAQSMGELLIRDGLTGLYNRRYLRERLAIELIPVGTAAATLALLVVDLNGFKQINDTQGHAAGDRLLVAVARVLGERVPGEGVACRYGGDEFVVALPGWGRAAACDWAQALLTALAETAVELESGQRVAGISASIGVAAWPDDAEDYGSLFAAADVAMYQAKRRPQGAVCDFAALKGVRSGPGRLRTGWEAPFVGREQERAEFAPATEKGGCLYGVTGGTGVGKSRLVAEVCAVAGRAGWAVVAPGAPGARPLGGVAAVVRSFHDRIEMVPALRRALRTLSEVEQARVQHLLAATAGAAAPDMDAAGPDVDAAAADVDAAAADADAAAADVDAAAADAGTAVPGADDACDAYDAYVEAAARLIRQTAHFQPLWLWLEDVHRWDEASLALIRDLCAQPLPEQLVAVLTVDPGETPAGAELVNCLRQMAAEPLPVRLVDLQPLSDPEMTQLIGAMLPGGTAVDLVAGLIRRCGGNPLALHATVQQWAEQGELSQSLGRWEWTGAAAAADGAGLAEILAARVAGLPPDLRQVLGALAVTVQPWTAASIGRVCGASTAEARSWLKEAERLQILVPDHAGSPAYRFANGLLRTSLYGQLGDLVRRAWHRLVAGCLQDLGAGAAELAEHWELAGNRSRAVEWHQRAAREAERYRVHRTASHHWRKAAELAADDPDLAAQRERWWYEAGRALVRADQNPEALACLQRASRPDATPQEAAEVLATMAQACRNLGDHQGVRDHALQALASLKGAPPSPMLACHHLFIAEHALAAAGDFAQSLRSARKARKIAQRLDVPDQVAVAARLIHGAYTATGRPGLAASWAQRALATPGIGANTRAVIAHRLALYDHDPRRGADLARRSLQEAAGTGRVRSRLYACEALVVNLAARGRWDEARVTFNEWRRLAWRTGAPGNVVWACAVWGALAVQHGWLDEVAALAVRCADLAAVAASPVSVGHLALIQASVHLFRGESEEGAIRAESLLTAGAPIPHGLERPLALLAAEARIDQHRYEDAETWLNRVWALGQGNDAWKTAGWVYRLQGRIAAGRHQDEAALAGYARAQQPPGRAWDAAAARLDEARTLHRLAPGGAIAAQRARSALQLAQRMGFPALAHQARQLLAELKAPPAPAGGR